MTTYLFDTQLTKGEEAERELDARYASAFVIMPVSRDGQRCGIDRIWTRHADGKALRVEYKADFAAFRTGNAFVETVSVDTTGKGGWALTSQADLLAYYVVGGGLVYFIYMDKIRHTLPRWKMQYRLVSASNNGYKTWGLLVPLREFEALAHYIDSGI